MISSKSRTSSDVFVRSRYTYVTDFSVGRSVLHLRREGEDTCVCGKDPRGMDESVKRRPITPLCKVCGGRAGYYTGRW